MELRKIEYELSEIKKQLKRIADSLEKQTRQPFISDDVKFEQLILTYQQRYKKEKINDKK